MTNCDVCIGVDVDSYDQATFYRESTPVARKSHKCCECGGEIQSGTRYFKAVGLWDGVLETFRECLLCREIQRVFTCGEGYIFGQLWGDMEGIFDSLRVTSPCFNQLSIEARVFLMERWWKWKERQ